jgi:pimeloyl-ACP methyl ester carboxylesterase
MPTDHENERANQSDRYRAGSGEPILLLDGVWESWHSWSAVLERLSAEREVLALTLRGHLGGRPFEAGQQHTIEAWADNVLAELDAAGFKSPDIAGASLGGWLALELAKRGRARSVVGISPAGMFTAEEGRAFTKKFRRDHRTVRLLLPVARRLVRTSRGRRLLLADNCVDPARIPPKEAERLVAEFAYCDVAGDLAANTYPGGDFARLEDLERVSCPVLILHPERDRVLSREHAQRFLAELPHAELRELPGCGHTAMFDNPELVASEILEFTRNASMSAAT